MYRVLDTCLKFHFIRLFGTLKSKDSNHRFNRLYWSWLEVNRIKIIIRLTARLLYFNESQWVWKGKRRFDTSKDYYDDRLPLFLYSLFSFKYYSEVRNYLKILKTRKMISLSWLSLKNINLCSIVFSNIF